MKLFKFLFVVMALLSAIPCFGRRVHLDGNWKHSKKSILVDLPMDASIEEASGELIVNFYENVGNVRVIVTSSTGEVIYNEMVQTSTMPSLVIPLKDQEKGVLQITDGYNNVYGFLFLQILLIKILIINNSYYEKNN